MKYFTYYFDNWYRPVAYFGLTALIMVLCEFTNNHVLQDSSFFLFLIGFLGLITSTTNQFIKGRWLFAILSTLIIGISIFGFLFYSLAIFWKDQSMPDNYADDLKIPTTVEINEPLIEDSQPTNTDSDFFILNGFQPGIYQYHFWTKRIEKGKVYLKAFELTNNDELSSESLQKRSETQVYNSTDMLKMFQREKQNSDLDKTFTIYEGDWGKPYAARFELWFIPENGEPERKLLEKNYKIEGWQR
jgi:hypothetical protein